MEIERIKGSTWIDANMRLYLKFRTREIKLWKNQKWERKVMKSGRQRKEARCATRVNYNVNYPFASTYANLRFILYLFTPIYFILIKKKQFPYFLILHSEVFFLIAFFRRYVHGSVKNIIKNRKIQTIYFSRSFGMHLRNIALIEHYVIFWFSIF